MEKKIENLSKLADDIALSEQDERKLFNAYKMKIESQRRKKNFMRTQYRIAAVAFAMIIVFLTTYFLQSPELTVYASTGNEMVQLELNEKVNLEKQKTPLGYGYVLEINVKEGSRYYTIPQPLAAIKQKRIILFVVACAIMHLITVSAYHSIGN